MQQNLSISLGSRNHDFEKWDKKIGGFVEELSDEYLMPVARRYSHSASLSNVQQIYQLFS